MALRSKFTYLARRHKGYSFGQKYVYSNYILYTVYLFLAHLLPANFSWGLDQYFNLRLARDHYIYIWDSE
jgi:hypothetical protein